LKAGNIAKARKSYEAFDAGWDPIEDLIKARSADAYVAVEKGMIQIEQALMADKPDVTQVDRLGDRDQHPVQRRPGDGGEGSPREEIAGRRRQTKRRSRTWDAGPPKAGADSVVERLRLWVLGVLACSASSGR